MPSETPTELRVDMSPSNLNLSHQKPLPKVLESPSASRIVIYTLCLYIYIYQRSDLDDSVTEFSEETEKEMEPKGRVVDKGGGNKDGMSQFEDTTH